MPTRALSRCPDADQGDEGDQPPSSKGTRGVTRVKTNKFGDVTWEKYKSITPHTTVDGVRAMPDQIKVVPPKEKKRKASSPPILEAEKHPWMTIALLEKKIEDLFDVIYIVEKRIDEDHVIARAYSAILML